MNQVNKFAATIDNIQRLPSFLFCSEVHDFMLVMKVAFVPTIAPKMASKSNTNRLQILFSNLDTCWSRFWRKWKCKGILDFKRNSILNFKGKIEIKNVTIIE